MKKDMIIVSSSSYAPIIVKHKEEGGVVDPYPKDNMIGKVSKFSTLG